MARPDLWSWPAPTASRYPTLRSAVHLSAEDALRLALAAYYAAVRDMQPSDGEKWLRADLEPLPWSCPRDLHDGFLHHLGERLWAHAAATGHLDQAQEIPRSPGAGRSPAGEGQGCPAFAPAVGPALGGSPAVDIITAGNPLFYGQRLQELPGVNRRDNLETAGEKMR